MKHQGIINHCTLNTGIHTSTVAYAARLDADIGDEKHQTYRISQSDVSKHTNNISTAEELPYYLLKLIQIWSKHQVISDLSKKVPPTKPVYSESFTTSYTPKTQSNIFKMLKSKVSIVQIVATFPPNAWSCNRAVTPCRYSHSGWNEIGCCFNTALEREK